MCSVLFPPPRPTAPGTHGRTPTPGAAHRDRGARGDMCPHVNATVARGPCTVQTSVHTRRFPHGTRAVQTSVHTLVLNFP